MELDEMEASIDLFERRAYLMEGVGGGGCRRSTTVEVAVRVADMANTGGRHDGSISTALFLKEFVDEKVRWLHIDLSGGMELQEKRGNGISYRNFGGMGIFTPSDELFKEVVAASVALVESHWESMESKVADMANTGGSSRWLRSLLFKPVADRNCVALQFVDEKVQWLHIDMAGPV
ncbi:hypothetical protein OSB04_012620 [Centaurea solstitialis]|uniref:Cytosol aminopeptidase domain-containing protein n=1 Tax=Centaurea solstitialis TaxID=347529 RepID=A0AA38WQR9_9ASTR|nr:hypothetical protein OSB04_012620 [Centaurea solstitialis]